MNKNTYALGIVLLAITVAAGIFQTIIFFKQGYSTAVLQSFVDWYLISSLVYLAAQLFIIRYFLHKKWKAIAIIGSIVSLSFLMKSAVEYYALLNVVRELSAIVLSLAFLNVVTTLALGVAIIITIPRKEFLMRLVGFLTAIQSILLLTFVMAFKLGIPQDTAMNAFLWLSASSLIFPVMYAIIFVNEIKKMNVQQRPSKTQELFDTGIALMTMISVVALLMVGGQLSKESYWHREWQKNGPEEQKKLAERFESRIYVNDNNDTLRYLLLRPLAYDSTLSYPLVTCLHGGPRQNAANAEVTQPAPLLSEPGNREKYPAFLFIPQAPPGVLWGGIPNIPSMESIVLEAMNALEKEFKIDPRRRYLVGISGGGYGTWHFISTHPKMFAAAMPICGAGNPDLAKEIVNVPVWAFHGTVDRNVSVEGSRKMIEALKMAGGNPKYSEFPGVGHNVWPEVSKTDGVLDWLFTQRLQE